MGQLVPLPSLVTPPMVLKPVGTRELDNHGSHLRQMQQASDGASSGLEKTTNHDFIDVRCTTAASETTQLSPSAEPIRIALCSAQEPPDRGRRVGCHTIGQAHAPETLLACPRHCWRVGMLHIASEYFPTLSVKLQRRLGSKNSRLDRTVEPGLRPAKASPSPPQLSERGRSCTM